MDNLRPTTPHVTPTTFHVRRTNPTNFRYTSLDVERWDGPTERHAVVTLPAFTYRSDGASGTFTRDVLATWLYGGTNHVSDRTDVDTIIGYFQAASTGSLPLPRHHSYNFEHPVHASIQHFLLGYGVAGIAYVWFFVWLLAVLFIGRRLWGAGAELHRQTRARAAQR